MYSTAGEETSGLESSFTSPSVHKDMIEQYLNKMGTSRDPVTGGTTASSALNAALLPNLAGLDGVGAGTAATDPLANLYSASLANHLPTTSRFCLFAPVH